MPEHGYSNKDEKGFTLLEVLASIAIFAILMVLTVANLSQYRNTQVLNGEGAQIVAILSKARSLTLASRSQLSYGVRLNTDRAILYALPTFASSTATNEEYIFHPSVRLSNISLAGGGLDISFARLTGETAEYGTFRIELSPDPSQYYTIEVKETGIVAKQ